MLSNGWDALTPRALMVVMGYVPEFANLWLHESRRGFSRQETAFLFGDAGLAYLPVSVLMPKGLNDQTSYIPTFDTPTTETVQAFLCHFSSFSCIETALLFTDVVFAVAWFGAQRV